MRVWRPGRRIRSASAISTDPKHPGPDRNLGARLRSIELSRLFDAIGLGREWYLIFCGGIVGAITALGAVGFAKALHATESATFGFLANAPLWLIPLPPILGALVTAALVHYLARDASGHGVPQVIEAIHKRGGRIPLKVGLVKIVASIATVGSGGSAGAEGPIVQIGSTAGSVMGRGLRVGRADMSTLLGCGAAAGIASVFNAPITGVFFVLEVLLRDFSLRTFTPIVVSSVFSVGVTQSLLGKDEAIFGVALAGYGFTIMEMPSFIALGIICAVIGVGFTRMLHMAEDLFARLRVSPLIRPAIGAAMLGLVGLVWAVCVVSPDGSHSVPAFFGNGYATIRSMVDPASYGAARAGSVVSLSLVAILSLCVLKSVGTSLTLGSGGSGGVFAPSLFVGAAAGGAFGMLLERAGLMPTGGTPASYALVGMAAVIAGTTFAPLTAILLLFELTREPKVLLPAMLACIVAAVVAQRWMRDSIYTARLRQSGLLLGGTRDLTVMRRVHLSSIKLAPLPPEPIYPSDPLAKVIGLLSAHRAPDFPVVDPSGKYLGMVTGEDVRAALIDREAIPLLLVAELLRTDLPLLSPEETLDTVIDKFAQHDVACICIVEPGSGVPRGLVTRAAVMKRYQQALSES
ncbi:MAG: chloride channel protein [Phycisphaeraceae bacterium]|nr:chloride channel protein [Phycisphaeraceae bacterium]